MSDQPNFYRVREQQATALNELCHIVNDWATKKGWNETPDSVGHKAEQIALMHSELSECLEFIRAKPQPRCPNGCNAGFNMLDSALTDCCACNAQPVFGPKMDDHVPSLTGEAAELADVLIRIFHYCGKRGIDLGQAVLLKHQYNITRPYKHGKVI